MVLNINLSNTLKNLWPKIPKKLGFFGFVFYFFFSITKEKKGKTICGKEKGEKRRLKKPPTLPTLQNIWLSQIANSSRMMCRMNWKLTVLTYNYSYNWLLSLLKAAKIWRMCYLRNLENAKMSMVYLVPVFSKRCLWSIFQEMYCFLLMEDVFSDV